MTRFTEGPARAAPSHWHWAGSHRTMGDMARAARQKADTGVLGLDPPPRLSEIVEAVRRASKGRTCSSVLL